MQLKRIVLTALVMLVAWSVSGQAVFASTDFLTSLKTSYVINLQGQTQVIQDIGLTNKTPTLFSTQYAVKISSPNIKNVKVTYNNQIIPAEVVPTDNQTSIGITFPDQLVGEGKTRQFQISYLNPDAAVVSGKVLEVQVPKLGNASDYDSYNVTITTPAQFGAPSRVTPTDYETRQDSNVVITSFNPNNGESVTALFGNQQVFEARLRYHLDNTSPNTGIAQIALPPDTSFQKVNYQVLEPAPQSIAKDDDGNWIATYEVQPQNQMTVYAVARILLTTNAQPFFPVIKPNNDEIAGADFWETDNATIKDIANQLATPREIYDYVVKNIQYDYKKLNAAGPQTRLGALQTLAKTAEATCQEFTDVFITLARSKGIPARRLTGYAYTQNQVLRPISLQQDVLHAWPEYYDQSKQQWIEVDPTWESTTGGVNYFDHFDLNHIVFAINGVSSTLPYPAGDYKTANNSDRDVEVAFGSDFPAIPLKVTPSIINSSPLNVVGKQHLKLVNQTGQAWYNIKIAEKQSAGQITVSGLPSTIDVLLPYQTLDFPITVTSPQVSFHATTTLQLELSYQTLADQPQTTDANQNHQDTSLKLEPVTVDVAPSFIQTLSQPWVYLALGGSCLILALIAGSLLVYGRRRSRPVRRKS